jgi:hypothetical protein
MEVENWNFASPGRKFVDEHDRTPRELSLQLKILVEMLKRFGAHKSGNQLESTLRNPPP